MQLIAERGADAAGPRLVALGGELTGNRQALVGPTTLDVIAGLRARTFFLDAAAVDVRGTYACSTAEARVARGLTEIADEVVLLAPATAFTGSAPALVTRLDRLTAVVTDESPPACVVSALAGAGVALHIAGDPLGMRRRTRGPTLLAPWRAVARRRGPAIHSGTPAADATERKRPL